MDINRRNFLNMSAVSLIGGIALSTASTSAFADDTDPTPVVLPQLGSNQTSAPAAPTSTVPAPSTSPAAARGEGACLGQAAIASAGYPLSATDSAEVLNQLEAYPASVKDLRAYPLDNGTPPSVAVTGAFGQKMSSQDNTIRS